MQINENHCVDCGLPCLGDSCPHRNVLVTYCDFCKNDGAIYHIDDTDYCESCVEEYLNDTFKYLTISEKAEILGITLFTNEG